MNEKTTMGISGPGKLRLGQVRSVLKSIIRDQENGHLIQEKTLTQGDLY